MILITDKVDELRDKYKDLQKSRYFYLSLTFATISIFVIFAIRPTVIQAIQAYNNLEDLKTLEVKLNAKDEQLNKANTLLTKYEDQTPLLRKAIPKESEESVFLSNLNETAYKNHVIIDEIEFEVALAGDQPTENSFKSVKFKASFDAKYTDLQTFLQDVNNFLRLVEITEVSIVQNASLKGQRVKGKVTGSIFYR